MFVIAVIVFPILAVLFILCILGMFGFWEWFGFELRKPKAYRKERELEFNPIKDMCEFKSQERARLLQEWDKEYLNLLPVGKRESDLIKIINKGIVPLNEARNLVIKEIYAESAKQRLELKQSDQPTEQETDREFVYWQQQTIKERYEGGYNARGHQSYY